MNPGALLVLGSVLLGAPDAGPCAQRIVATEAYGELDGRFPGSLEVRGRGCAVIQFCPDNTCDAVAAKGPVSPEVLMEFLYLYVYWFSEYVTLEEWRSTKGARELATRILVSWGNAECRRSEEKESARCAMRALAKRRGIRLVDVRYDEGVRAETPRKLP